MGLLVILFTAVTLMTTWRFSCTIASSITLKFENQSLLEDLQRAKRQTDVLNEQLEMRVQERTAELRESTERLRAEIRHREETEEELLRARKLDSLGVLAGGIAHDFNNFLTIIQGSIELAQLRLGPGGPVREILDRTVGACQRAVFLASQLLTFAHGGSPVRRVVSVAKLVLDAVELARAGSGVGMNVSVANDLLFAEVDASQIGQVLHNLLLNAKQATLDSGVIEVRAENVSLPDNTTQMARPHVRISIKDYGCGIAADVLPRIFDPYFTTKRGASGLGLATAYAIVSKHGGHLSVQSTDRESSTFIVDLPASHASPAPAPAVVRPRLRTGAGRLLVMDDEESLRTLMVEALTRLGYDVHGAGDGAEAIDLYEAAKASGRPFDAVLLDLTVRSGMGGVETARRLRESDPSARLIASSGYSDAPVMSRFRDYGFTEVLPKPWAVAQLSDVVRRVIERAADDILPENRTAGVRLSDAPPDGTLP